MSRRVIWYTCVLNSSESKRADTSLAGNGGLLAMAHQHSPGFLKLVQDAKSRVREVTVDQVKAKLDRGERFALVDVREDNEWVKDHVTGAIHLGKGIIERDAEQQL